MTGGAGEAVRVAAGRLERVAAEIAGEGTSPQRLVELAEEAVGLSGEIAGHLPQAIREAVEDQPDE